MPEQLENKTVKDSEWDWLERNYAPYPPNRRERRLQRVIDEMEYGRMEENKYESL